MELPDYLDFTVQTAYEAGRLTLGYFRTGTMCPELEPDDTPVTAADREAEKLIRARIGSKDSGHAEVGKSTGSRGRESPLGR